MLTLAAGIRFICGPNGSPRFVPRQSDNSEGQAKQAAVSKFAARLKWPQSIRVITIANVAEMLGISEDLIDKLCIGWKTVYLRIYGPGDQQTQAFALRHRSLRQLIAEFQR